MTPQIKKLGILAGGGAMPAALIEACAKQGIEPFVIAFENQTDPQILSGIDHEWSRLGAVGHVLKALRANGIHDLVLIGSIRRPSLSELKPDLKAAAFFAKNGLKAMGDNDLLQALREFLEEEGFNIHGIQKFASEILCPDGPVTKHKPSKDDWIDIRRGVEVLTAMGPLDIGQAVIVQEGLVLGVEAIEGTDDLIKRCAPLKRKGRGGVLVKLCKLQQDRDLDLPSIGPQTIENLAAHGYAGLALHAKQALLLKREEVAKIADHHKMFVVGINPEEIKTVS